MNSGNIVEEAIRSGKVSKTINKDKQKHHAKDDHIPGRSYWEGDCDFVQKLADKYAGKGVVILDRHNKYILF